MIAEPSCESNAYIVQCDKKPLPHGCTPCNNLCVTCPGYANTLDASFHDESQSVPRKYSENVNRSRSGRNTPAISPPIEDSSKLSLATFGSELDCSLLGRSLRPSVQSVALKFFLTTYCDGSRFMYLPSLYSEAGAESLLHIAIEAAALSSLAGELREAAVLQNARKYYVKALKGVNEALTDPRRAVMDSTLVVVLVLGLYESLSSFWSGSTESYLAHSRGALLLIQMRGESQFHSKLGRQLFLQVSTILRVSGAAHLLRTDVRLLELEAQGMANLGVYDPILKLGRILDDFADLRVGMEEKTISAQELVETAQQIDSRLVRHASDLPAYWAFETLKATEFDGPTYNGYYHRYRDHHVAQYWNSIRLMRLWLNEWTCLALRLGMCEPAKLEFDALSDSQNELHHKAFVAAQTSAEEICASVPQFADRLDRLPNDTPTLAARLALIWPLHSAGACSLSPESLRDYVVDRLHFIGTKSGLPQAFEAAKPIEKRVVPGDWYAEILFRTSQSTN